MRTDIFKKRKWASCTSVYLFLKILFYNFLYKIIVDSRPAALFYAVYVQVEADSLAESQAQEDEGQGDVVPTTEGQGDVGPATDSQGDAVLHTDGQGDVVPPTDGQGDVVPPTKGQGDVVPPTEGQDDVVPPLEARNVGQTCYCSTLQYVAIKNMLFFFLLKKS